MTKERKRVDFDEYADEYEALLQGQLSFFSKDRGYFSEYKAALAAKHCTSTPKRVLDFGCGIGLSIPFLIQHFPNSQIFATDLSQRSLAYVKDKFPEVSVCEDGELEVQRYDLIFVSGVFHHIPPSQRNIVMERLSKLLIKGGQIIIFEHNPHNPVTRHMVNTCPFDEDAVLLKLSEMKRLISVEGVLKVEAAGYCLFFPQPLTLLRSIESALTWLPLGGQHFVVAYK